MKTTLESQLRLIVANRRVAWLASWLPEACSRASRLSWRNEFFPEAYAARWSRVVIFAYDDQAAALKLLAPNGCVVLVEDLAKATSLSDLSGGFFGRIETDDGFALTLFRESADRNELRASINTLVKQHKIHDRWRGMRRWLIAIKRFGPSRRRAILHFLRDLKVLDAEMAPHNDYYATSLADPREAFDPAIHYFLNGARLGLNPTPHFSTKHYVSAYPDVLEAGVNPFLHYLRHGRREGRLAMPVTLGASTLPRSLPSPLTDFARIAPSADVQSAVFAEPLAIDWQRVVANGPCSVVLLGTNPMATALWLKPLLGPATIPGLDRVVITPHRINAVSNGWRHCACAPDGDIVAAGIAAAEHDRIIICADYMLPMPDALGCLSDRIDGAELLVTGRIVTSSGVLLSLAWSGSSKDGHYQVLGDWTAPRWFQSRQQIDVSPHFVAGTRQLLLESMASWQRDERPSAILAPQAIACLTSDSALTQVNRLAPIRAYDEHGGKSTPGLSVMIDNWMEATVTSSFAVHAFLLDAASAFGAVHLYCRTQFLPLSDLEWLGERGIHYYRADTDWGGQDAPAKNSITMGPIESGDSMSTVCSMTRKTVSLERLREIYARHYSDTDIVGPDALDDASGRHFLCLCPDAAAASAISDWIAERSSGAVAPRKFIAVGQAARHVLSCGRRLDRSQVMALPERDWLRLMDWADVIVAPSATKNNGSASARRVQKGSEFNRSRAEPAFRRIAELAGDVGS